MKISWQNVVPRLAFRVNLGTLVSYKIFIFLKKICLFFYENMNFLEKCSFQTSLYIEKKKRRSKTLARV